jgi:phosphoribosylformimino-5-aminoimidazole carboxamide ribotide isomerase
LKEIAEFSSFPVIASGGITSLEDLTAVQSIGPKIEGAIVGKALYDGKLDYQTAVAAICGHRQG